MKKNIFLFLILLFCQPVFSADVGLECTIKANKEIYTAGEPVIIEFVLKNVSDKPLTLFVGNIQLNVYTNMEITNISGRDKQPVKKSISRCGKKHLPIEEFISLKPNEAYKTSLDISNCYYKIRFPGKYKITVRYNNFKDYYYFKRDISLSRTPIDIWKGKVYSSPIIIEIKEGETSFVTPKGRINLEMGIQEVKNILGEKKGFSKEKDGEKEMKEESFTRGTDKLDILTYKFYSGWGDLEKSFVIFFYNGKVIDWETLG